MQAHDRLEIWKIDALWKDVSAETIQYTAEPELWFHDIFRENGEPYIKEEVAFLKRLLKQKKEKNYPV